MRLSTLHRLNVLMVFVCFNLIAFQYIKQDWIDDHFLSTVELKQQLPSILETPIITSIVDITQKDVAVQSSSSSQVAD